MNYLQADASNYNGIKVHPSLNLVTQVNSGIQGRTDMLNQGRWTNSLMSLKRTNSECSTKPRLIWWCSVVQPTLNSIQYLLIELEKILCSNLEPWLTILVIVTVNRNVFKSVAKLKLNYWFYKSEFRWLFDLSHLGRTLWFMAA